MIAAGIASAALVGTGTAEFSGDGVPPRQAGLNYPFGVAVDGEGTIFIADTFNHRIRRFGCNA